MNQPETQSVGQFYIACSRVVQHEDWVLKCNPNSLHKFKTHINTEKGAIDHIQAIQKYHKPSNQKNGEIKRYINCKYICPAQACWRNNNSDS